MDNETIANAEAALADLENTRAAVVQRLKQVRSILDLDGMTVIGSRGQVRPHPLLATEAALRQELDRTRRGMARVQAELDRLRLFERGRARVEAVNAIFKAALTPRTNGQ